MKNKMYPCLWFDGQAEVATKFYCSLFKNSSITSQNPLVALFEIEGRKIMALNGGPQFKVNPSISLFVNCQTDTEIESLYKGLIEGGGTLMPLDKYPWSEKYAWVKDKFGVTWQLMLTSLTEGQAKIHPAFLFSNQQFGKALEAMRSYSSLFPESRIHTPQLYVAGEGQPEGYLKFGHFTLCGEMYSAMDGPGDHAFAFNEGFSIVVNCKDQKEIDLYWNELTKGGEESMCGWLKDKYGVSWQIVPEQLGALMSLPEKGQRVIQAFMKMKKFDIATLENA